MPDRRRPVCVMVEWWAAAEHVASIRHRRSFHCCHCCDSAVATARRFRCARYARCAGCRITRHPSTSTTVGGDEVR